MAKTIIKPVYEKTQLVDTLDFDAEQQTKRSDRISTHQDILEFHFNAKITYTVATATNDHLLSFYQFLEQLRIYSGATDFVKINKDEIKYTSQLWQPQDNCNGILGGGGLPVLAVAAGSIVELDFTIPVLIKRNTQNVKIALKVGEFDDIFELGSAVNTFTSMQVKIYAHYANLEDNEFTRSRAGSFRIESSEYDVSANGDASITFKEDYILDNWIIFTSENTTTQLRANHLADNIESIILEHSDDKLVDVDGEIAKLLAKDANISTEQFCKTLNAVDVTRICPFVYFFLIDDLPIENNTKGKVKFNASAGITDILHSVVWYFR